MGFWAKGTGFIPMQLCCLQFSVLQRGHGQWSDDYTVASHSPQSMWLDLQSHSKQWHTTFFPFDWNQIST